MGQSKERKFQTTSLLAQDEVCARSKQREDQRILGRNHEVMEVRRFWNWNNPLILLPSTILLMMSSPDNYVQLAMWWAGVIFEVYFIVCLVRNVFRRYLHWDPFGGHSDKTDRTNDKTH